MKKSDVEAIQEFWKTYSSAWVAGDADLWLSLYDKDGIQMPPGMPARGKDVLNENIPQEIAASKASAMNVNPKEVTVADGWAYSRGEYDLDQVVQGKDVHAEGKFLTILKRQSDGSWKIYRDCFNSNTQ